MIRTMSLEDRLPPKLTSICHMNMHELKGMSVENFLEYDPRSLTVEEMRAVYACLPPRFLNDKRGYKEAWREAIRTILMIHIEAQSSVVETRIPAPVSEREIVPLVPEHYTRALETMVLFGERAKRLLHDAYRKPHVDHQELYENICILQHDLGTLMAQHPQPLQPPPHEPRLQPSRMTAPSVMPLPLPPPRVRDFSHLMRPVKRRCTTDTLAREGSADSLFVI